MGRIYDGPEPCAGCGVSGKDRPRSNGKYSLCRDCQKYLMLGRKVVDNKEPGYTLFRLHPYSLHSFSVHRDKTELEKEIEAGTNSRSLFNTPYVSVRSTKAPYYVSDTYKSKAGSSKELSVAFKNVLSVMNVGVKSQYDMTAWEVEAHSDTMVVRTDLALAMLDLADVIADYSRRIAEENKEAGKNLLMRLNSGDIKPTDFYGK